MSEKSLRDIGVWLDENNVDGIGVLGEIFCVRSRGHISFICYSPVVVDERNNPPDWMVQAIESFVRRGRDAIGYRGWFDKQVRPSLVENLPVPEKYLTEQWLEPTEENPGGCMARFRIRDVRHHRSKSALGPLLSQMVPWPDADIKNISRFRYVIWVERRE